MEEGLQRSLLSAVQRMTETLGRAEGSARSGELSEAMVFLAALEKDAGGERRGPGTRAGDHRRPEGDAHGVEGSLRERGVGWRRPRSLPSWHTGLG